MLRTSGATSLEEAAEDFWRRAKAQASMRSEIATLLIHVGLSAGGQVKMRRIEGRNNRPRSGGVAALRLSGNCAIYFVSIIGTPPLRGADSGYGGTQDEYGRQAGA